MKTIDAMMLKMPVSVALRWCEPGESGCGCMGCANHSGGLLKAGFTKQDWLDWKERQFAAPDTEGKK